MIKIDELRLLSLLNKKSFAELEDYIKKEVARQSIKSISLSRRMRAFESVSRLYYKKYNAKRKEIAGCTIIDGNLFLTDGYKAFKAKFDINAMPKLQIIPEDKNLVLFDYNRLFKEAIRNEKTREAIIDYDKFRIQLKEYKSMRDRQSSLRYFEVKTKNKDLSVIVDIAFLDEVDKIMDISNCHITVTSEESAVCFFNEEGDSVAMLFPIRRKKK